MTRPRKNSGASGIRTQDLRSRGGRLTTRPTRRSLTVQWRRSASRPLDTQIVPRSRHTRGRYHGGRRPSSDDSLHGPTVIALGTRHTEYHEALPSSANVQSHTSPRRSPTMATLHDTRRVECRWWNDGWTVKTVVT